MRRVRVDYTVYSPGYIPGRDSQGRPQDGHGELWDCATFRSAKRVAKRLGIGSQIVRNFNQAFWPDGSGDWWQMRFCRVWDGLAFRKAWSLSETRWDIPESAWIQSAALERFHAKRL